MGDVTRSKVDQVFQYVKIVFESFRVDPLEVIDSNFGEDHFQESDLRSERSISLLLDRLSSQDCVSLVKITNPTVPASHKKTKLNSSTLDTPESQTDFYTGNDGADIPSVENLDNDLMLWHDHWDIQLESRENHEESMLTGERTLLSKDDNIAVLSDNKSDEITVNFPSTVTSLFSLVSAAGHVLAPCV